MKKIIALFVCLLLTSSLAFADDHKRFNWFGLVKPNTSVTVQSNPAQTKVKVKHNNGKHYGKSNKTKVKIHI